MSRFSLTRLNYYWIRIENYPWITVPIFEKFIFQNRQRSLTFCTLANEEDVQLYFETLIVTLTERICPLIKNWKWIIDNILILFLNLIIIISHYEKLCSLPMRFSNGAKGSIFTPFFSRNIAIESTRDWMRAMTFLEGTKSIPEAV